ncbi:MAG: diphthine--ammonia ligase [Candidatus Thermoplasmatota archaeon]|nr:diphthine--ammonia ligase [Candidatus Thermoplasmatota archaeon]MCL5730818.1 diphthine--ammonia ligase [Candidatus Thermoplasmatota archaeon]
MKGISLLSGGKDSFFSTVIAIDQGMEILRSLTVLPEEFSMMYHFPNANKASLVSDLLGIPWEKLTEDELAGRIKSLYHEGAEFLIAGATASEYQKTRLEAMCSEIGISLYTPLWRIHPEIILDKLLESGITAIIVSVSAEGLVPSDLGSLLDRKYISHLKSVSSTTGINIVGEGGEYETFVTGYSGSSLKVNIERSKSIWNGSHGYFIIEDACLMPKI